MSVTKHENEDGKLTSQADVNTVILSNKSSRCSCPECDSVGCFARRNKELCHCGECKDIKNCLSLLKKKSQENKSGDSNDTNKAGDSKDTNKAGESKDIATKKIIREVVTRETIESLKKVTETLYGFDNENFEMITDRLSKLSNKKIKPPCKTSEISNKSVCTNDGIKKTDTKECCKHIPIVRTPSIDVNQPQKEAVNTATKLSAQVMNVPYEEINESVPSNQGSEQIPISKLNIFKRIKEIYEACSCKVCECISSKPITVPDEVCKCEPCDCHDCASLRRKLDQNIKKIPPSGCPCIRCDRKDCKGIAKQASEPLNCDCKPCDCLQCTENIQKPCDCEPCQCVNCKSLKVRKPKTVKMAKVDDIIQSEICQCSPCECIECKQIYNRTNPTVMCTTSTEMTRYSHCRCKNCLVARCQFGETETCTCHRNTSMRKSFEKTYNDYDIRTVIVDANSPFNQQKQNVFKKQSAIALFTSLESNYPYNSSNKNVCKCVECECIECPGRDETIQCKRDNILQSNVRLVQNYVNLSTSFRNACTCTSCECEICTKNEREQNLPIHSKCKCETCDCLNCDKASFPTSSADISKSAKPIKMINKNNNCTCNPCECINCRKLLGCTSQNSVKFYSDRKRVERKTARSFRKVMLISPSSSGFHNSQKVHIKSSSSITLSPKKSTEGIFRQDIATCQYSSRNGYPSVSHPLNTEQDNSSNNIDSHDGFKRNVLFNLRNHPIESTSQSNKESVQDRNIVETYNNLHEITLKSLKLSSETSDKLSEPKYKDFSIVHEKPFKISPTVSNESLPVFLTYHNETLYSNNLSQNHDVNYKMPVLKPIDDLNKCMTTKPQSKCCIPSCSHVGNVNKDLCERTEQKNNHTIRDINKRFVDDYLTGLKGFCKDKSYENICYKEHNGSHEPYKYTNPFRINVKNNDQKSDGSSIDNNSDLIISYEKATKVLREAKAFSKKLVQMLDSFDKANREFKSKSEKFKKLHKSLLDINHGEANKSFKTTTSRPYQVSYENISNTIHEFEETEENTKNKNEAEKEYEQFIRKPMEINNLQQDIIDNTSLKMKCLNGDNVDTLNLYQGNSKNTEYFVPQQSSKQDHGNKHFNTSTDILLKKSKTSHRLISKCTSHGTNYLNQGSLRAVGNANGANEHIKRMASVMRKLDSVFGNTTNDDLAVKLDDAEKKSEQEERRPGSVFMKNLFINTVPPSRRQNIFGSPTTDFDIKEAIQAIKLQTPKNNSPKVISRASEALTNLQTEVSSLLNMPILQCKKKAEVADAACNPETKERNYFYLKNMSSTASSQTHDRMVVKVDKQDNFNSDQMYEQSTHQTHESNCDAFKVRFVGLRRISDHTVLVKWSAPKCLKDIKGYELLVDGLAAQRCGVARRAAVLTCLPAAARVLLSVRAVGPRATPAHTVLYRPRR